MSETLDEQQAIKLVRDIALSMAHDSPFTKALLRSSASTDRSKLAAISPALDTFRSNNESSTGQAMFFGFAAMAPAIIFAPLLGLCITSDWREMSTHSQVIKEFWLVSSGWFFVGVLFCVALLLAVRADQSVIAERNLSFVDAWIIRIFGQRRKRLILSKWKLATLSQVWQSPDRSYVKDAVPADMQPALHAEIDAAMRGSALAAEPPSASNAGRIMNRVLYAFLTLTIIAALFLPTVLWNVLNAYRNDVPTLPRGAVHGHVSTESGIPVADDIIKADAKVVGCRALKAAD